MNDNNLTIARAMAQPNPPDMDLENRILRRVVVATRRLATDGFIIEPAGIDLRQFLENPIVTADHDGGTGVLGPVIARALELTTDAEGLVSQTQFAETELGREYAYLYGLNPKKEVYMRAWSIHGSILQRSSQGFGKARVLLGALWDQDLADQLMARGATGVSVAERFLMKSYAATKVGADRGALTRAHNDGIKTAGTIAAALDLEEARGLIAGLREELARRDIEEFSRQVQALARDGADAARRGDSSALLEELRQISRVLRAAKQ